MLVMTDAPPPPPPPSSYAPAEAAHAAADEGASGVRVNTVAPGFIRTEATEKHARGVGQTVDAVVAEMATDTLLGRMGRPEEVAAAIAFLASADSSFITGTTLLVDGGTFPR
jgi:NAD(P)-dependent dehydrogenase (short-subunit alcohol dehydrogenase family)